MQKSKGTIKKSVMPAALTGAIKRKKEQAPKPVQKFLGALLKPLGLSKKDEVPMQKILGGLLSTLGLASKQESEQPVQKFLPAIAAPLAVGAIGGKLLGLSKKEGVPMSKFIPGLTAAMQGVGDAVGGAGKAVGAAGTAATGAAQGVGAGVGQATESAGRAAGSIADVAGSVGDVAGAAGKKVAGAINPTKSQLAKHRGKTFHSHKRKNPFTRRKR